MPEIAEVETVRKTLKRQILNKKITNIDVYYDGIILGDVIEFKNILINKEFTDIKRIGKWLIFELGELALLSHLRMEGKFFLKSVGEEKEKHEHVIFSFEDGSDLRYHDTRKFGKMKVLPLKEVLRSPEISKQGHEPNSKELTADYLLDNFKGKNLAIKTLLLDQTIISGLGNIYANEVLFASKINPMRKGSSITKKECERIVNSANEIIKKAIEQGGTTIKSYTSSLGVTGRFQQYLKVHKRENEECLECGSLIKNEKVNGRSTYYCPNCQR